MFRTCSVQLALLRIYSSRDATFFEKWHFIWQITEPQGKYENNKQLCKTVMVAKHRTRDGCYSGSNGRERSSSYLLAIVKKWVSEQEQVAVPDGVIEEKAAVKALISDALFNLPFFVHNSEFCLPASVVSCCF